MSERGARFIGKPCRRCGGTERYANGTRACVQCTSRHNRFRYLAIKDEHLARTNANHAANRAAHIEQMRIGQLRRKFGISASEYDQMLAAQDGKCAICESVCGTGRRLAVDHHHTTGANRGLLCHACNLGIGKFRDSPELLSRAIEYLKRYAIQDITGA